MRGGKEAARRDGSSNQIQSATGNIYFKNTVKKLNVNWT